MFFLLCFWSNICSLGDYKRLR